MQSDQFKLHADIEQQHWWFVARRQILRTIVEQILPPHSSNLIVDVGCGTGANIAAFAGSYACLGIDTSQAAIESAQKRFPGVRFLQGHAPQDLDQSERGADLFLITDVMEHVPDDFLFLSQLVAAAKPGAYFVITVPAHEALWSEHDVSFGHYRRYDRQRFEASWAGLPVTTLMTSYYNARLHPIVKAMRSLSRRRGRAWGGAGSDFLLPPPLINGALTRLFAGEQKRLLHVLASGRHRGYDTGVSLITVLRRDAGVVEAHRRPDHIAADNHDPQAAYVH